MNKPRYKVKPLVSHYIEFTTGSIFAGTWCRYSITLTLHQCYIEAIWKVRPSSSDKSLDGHKETFNTLQEYLDWFDNLKKTYKKRITRNQMMYASYNEELRTFEYTPYENAATRRSREKLNKPKEPLLADGLY